MLTAIGIAYDIRTAAAPFTGRSVDPDVRRARLGSYVNLAYKRLSLENNPEGP